MGKMDKARPLIQIIQGQLRGIVKETLTGKPYAAFKGIPYAKPPIGQLRFRDPMPPEPWSSLRDASKFGSNCAQLDPTTRVLQGSDDCLYLNVYTPSYKPVESSPKAVMVWIHGGLFAYGSGDDTLFGPDYIMEKDVILVTINYRLNVLGFINLDDEEVSGNQGLKDQVLALKWVQKNISHFGGDPNNVTIFGESAGGSSVHYLTLSPLAKGLFHKAISQSGVAINPWACLGSDGKIHAQELARELGEEINDSKILAEFLRGVDAQKLVELDVKISSEVSKKGFRYFVPTIDSKSKNPFLPISPTIASQNGVQVPYMIGHTSDEGILFLTGMSDKKLEALNNSFEGVLSPTLINYVRGQGLQLSDLKNIYFGNKRVSRETRENFVRMQSDCQFVRGIHEICEIQASKKKDNPTYFYNFSYDNRKSIIKVAFGLDIPGVCHADELPYIFHTELTKLLGFSPPAPGSTEQLVRERMLQMWTNFAKTGNPTPSLSKTLPIKWEPLENPDDLRCLHIGEDLCMKSIESVNKRWMKEKKSKL